ncbi:MAG: hypothetical protein KF684_01170 [Phycisphaeraceae bacterium]|nr:hypothetical protein [Phycisphaeraceae bacterium]
MNRACLAMISLAACASHALAQSTGDLALERYLESHSLGSALIEHLEARLSAVGGAERAALAERLTRLVAQELESTTNASRRADLERRARALLDVIPEADSLDLRLSLHRAAYSNAEQIAERWRLRLASSEEAEEARRVFTTLAAELGRLGTVAHRRVDNLERMEQAARDGADEEAIAQQLADARRQRSMAMYLAGWCLTYLAEMTNQRAPAIEALPRFGWILNAEPGKPPTLDRVPDQTLRFEHVARAALGVSASISVSGDAALATRWIDAVEESNRENAELLAFAAKRRIITLARAARWTELFEYVRELRGVPASAPESAPTKPLDPATSRLVAVLAFELPQGGQPAPQQALRRVAFADLVASGQTPQVIDLAQRYGTEALGDVGFVTDYVRGLQAFRAARDAHSQAGAPDEPSADPSLASLYAHASRLLEAALRAPDAKSAGDAMLDAMMLRASAAFFSAGADPDALLAAAALFEQAGSSMSGPRAADALWNRVRSLRLAARHASHDRSKFETLAADAGREFSDRFPSDPRAGALVLERASRESATTQNPDLLDALLSIEPGSSSYIAARRQAAAMLFRAAQSAPGDAARAEALRFAEIAGPLLDADTQSALGGDSDAAARAVLLARQILAVMLTDSVSEPALAQRAADRLGTLVRAGLVREPDTLAEFRYRELQIALLVNDATRAESALTSLRAIDAPGAGAFLVAADRLAYRRALAAWRESPSTTAYARAVVASGVRVIDSFGTGEATLRDGAVLGVYLAVSDAGALLASEEGDREALGLARRLIRRVLVAHPSSSQALRRSAQLAELADEYSDASDAWRVLKAGAEFGSDSWFEASYHLARVTARFSEADAAALLSRHFELFPTGGAPPWDARFASLRERVDAGRGTRGDR